MSRLIFSTLLFLSVLSSAAQDPWINVYRSVDGKTRVSSFDCQNISSITYTPASGAEDYFTDVNILDKDNNMTSLPLNGVSYCEVASNLPSLYLTTDDATLSEIPSKDYYVTGKLVLEGHGNYPDVSATALNIKGRGNTTWNYPKKPYRLKFDKKISLCGLKKAKNYVLIANYIDCTLLRNPIAFKVAQLLEMPYTNHTIPVNLYLNGDFRGSYMLTEKVGINGASVDIDETQGIMWELDSYYDEEPKFRSSIYNLPVMVKDPDFDDLVAEDSSLTTAGLLSKWKNDFQEFENTLANNSGKDFADYLDIESLVDYFIVCNICYNCEPKHPKSVYMYKEKQGEKYKMGPVWDFDWAFNWDGYNNTATATNKLLSSNYDTGTRFFKKLLSDSRVQQLYGQKWKAFKENKLDELWAFFEEYSQLIKASAYRDGEIWQPSWAIGQSTETYESNVSALKTWLNNRISYIDSASNYGLY